MNDVPHLFAGTETMIFTVRVLIQVTLLISLALLLARWRRHQPALRHSILLGGLLCVLISPAAAYLADRMDIAIPWPMFPASQTEPATPYASATAGGTARASSPKRTSTLDDSSVPLAALPPDVATAPRPATHVEDESEAALPERDSSQVASLTEHVAVTPDVASVVPFTSASTQRPVWLMVGNIAALLWILGIVVISIRLLLAWRYLSHLRSTASAFDEQRLPQFRHVPSEVLQSFAVKRQPLLLVSDRLQGPISLGLFRPAILLPQSATRTLNASQLRDVLIHETAHIHRRDQFVILLQRLAGALFWPLPLVRVLNARIDQAREDVCDNYVLRYTEASQYSRLLLKLTERAAPPETFPLAVGLWQCRRKLEQRVAALLDPRRTTQTRLPRRTLCTLAVAFASIVVLLGGSRISDTSRAQAEEPNPPAAKAANTTADTTQANAGTEDKPVANSSDDSADPYDTLYDVIMTRYGKDGRAYGQNETSPAIFAWSEFPFDDKTFGKFNAAMDAFAALPQEKIEAYSDVKRALLQRHLWKVFDTTLNWDWKKDWYWAGRKSFPKPQMERRSALQSKIAALIRRLALTKDEILALPNPLEATVKSGGFAQAHNPSDRFQPFLPSDLYASAESSWICVGEHRTRIPAQTHTVMSSSRSMFLQFMRLPGGRADTLEYMESIQKKVRQFPVGTQFALIEQPFLISNEGELVLSPMIVSVLLRAYLNVGRSADEAPTEPTQCVAEFVMQPRELIKGNAIMKAIGPNEFRYEAGSVFVAGSFNPRDPFATGDIAVEMPTTTRLNLCMDCHGSRGGHGVMTRSFQTTNNFFLESGAKEISAETSAQKRADKSWKTLQEHWRSTDDPKANEAKIAALLKPQPRARKPREPKPDKYPDDPKARTALIDLIHKETVNELKTLHTAVLLAEAARLSEMFDLDDRQVSKLRIAARGAAHIAVSKSSDALIGPIKERVTLFANENDVNLEAVHFNNRTIRVDAEPGDRNSDKKRIKDILDVSLKRRSSKIASAVNFTWLSRSGVPCPQDADLQKAPTWRNAISEVLTEEQRKQYSNHLKRRFKSNVVSMILAALQFDLDLSDSQLPVVRKRIEERINPTPSPYSHPEPVARRLREQIQAEHLSDILTKEQLETFQEPTRDRIKSAIVTIVVSALQLDLHLQDAQLPVVRQRIEERINPRRLFLSIEADAIRVRWRLRREHFADILTESQQTLWRYTQGE